VELALRLKAVLEEVVNGTFKPNREGYQLSRALGNKEHPGCTRGFGLVPWELSSPDDISYRSSLRRTAQKELEWQCKMEAVRPEMKESNKKLRPAFEENLTNCPSAPDEDAANWLISPDPVQSSCGSITLPLDDTCLTFPVDKITTPTTFNLYVQEKFYKTKVPTGLAYACGRGCAAEPSIAYRVLHGDH
jgi:hypothetical protein